MKKFMAVRRGHYHKQQEGVEDMKEKYSNKSTVIADPEGFVKSLEESKNAYENRYFDMGMAYARQLINLNVIDYHALYAFHQMLLKVYYEELEDDLLPSIKKILSTIGKKTLWEMIDKDINHLAEDDLTLETELFAFGLTNILSKQFVEFEERSSIMSDYADSDCVTQ